jgi:ATP-dependent RNA helicase DHX37/DHR1
VKDKTYQKGGISKFEIKWISKASADQRAGNIKTNDKGRAGRTGPGHVYRLFSSAVYDQKFEQFATPDILKTPIENLVLHMKCMGIQNILKFPFPSQPDNTSLKECKFQK